MTTPGVPILAAIQLGFNPVLTLGPLMLRWETLGVTLALLLALGLAAMQAPSLDRLVLILVGIVPGAVVGGRLVHVLDYLGAYLADPASIVDPRVGSLSLTGAVLGGTLSALYVCRLLNTSPLKWSNVAAIPLLVAMGIGKLAQLLGGSGQGVPFDGAWAVAFTGDGPWVSLAASVPSHPSQLYEALWLLAGIPVVLAIGGAARADRTGSSPSLFVGALAWFLLGRFLIGFTWRDPSIAGPLNMEQVVALVLLAAGGWYTWLRRARPRGVLAAMLSLTLVGCGASTSPVTPVASIAPPSTGVRRTPAPTPAPTPNPTGTPIQTSIDNLLATMSTDQKIGQLFMVSFNGDLANETDPAQIALNQQRIGTDTIVQAIAKFHLGGVIYFAVTGNLVSAAQIATLSNAIQAAGAAENPAIPLLFSTDQEGGSIVRLPTPATHFPGNMALGATGSTDLASSVGKAMGEELRAVGINQVLAPDGDVNVNPANPIIGVRSFGSDAAAVASMTAAMVAGFQSVPGVGATVKHFPGHGDTNIDSHSQLPLITHSAAQWASIDQPPFTAALGAGVDAVMVGHLAFPALDATGTPSSLSKPIVTGILRGQMGFEGVVITDSLVMGALRNTYGDAGIPVKAIEAGDDVLLMPQSLPVAFAAVQAAIANGQISTARLDASVRRILTLKQKLGLFGEAPVSVPAAVGALSTPAHLAIEQRADEASVTLLANDSGVLPIAAAAAVADGPYLVVGSDPAATANLVALLRARGLTVGRYVTGLSPGTSIVATAAARAAGYGTVIDLTFDADADTGQQAVVQAIAATGARLITASIGRPYDQAYYRAATNVCLYSSSTASLRAFVRVLFGEIAPAGKLPVSIPDPSAPGKTLYPLGFGLSY